MRLSTLVKSDNAVGFYSSEIFTILYIMRLLSIFYDRKEGFDFVAQG